MNIGIVLNYFRYFLHFPQYDAESSYRFITSREKYTSEHISSLHTINWRDYATVSRKAIGDVDTIFKSSLRLGLIPKEVDVHQLCAFYEYSFEHFLKQQNIDVLISGGVSGFERAGIATAHRMGIKTFCIWEGFFRPVTMSVDPEGMNAESTMMRIPYRELMRHHSSEEFKMFYNDYINRNYSIDNKRKNIKEIHGDKFQISRQFRNRWEDRHDIERIKLPLSQHLYARASYSINSRSYKTLEEVTKPFIFFPLQTHTDSNVIINAYLFPYSRYVNVVQKAFQLIAAKTGIQLVIKEHPFDVFRTAYPQHEHANILWIHPAISSNAILHNTQCVGCVVVNSTVGLESLIFGKPVLCLGEAVYSHTELVEKSLDESTEAVAEAMTTMLSRRVDQNDVRRFCGALYDHMQIPLNIETVPQKNDIPVFWNNIKKR
jgi:capsule polysaccharide modification protein KpsS